MKTKNERILVYRNEDEISRENKAAKQGLVPIQVFLDEAKEAGIPVTTDNLSEALHNPEAFARKYFESIAPEAPELPGGFTEKKESFLSRIEFPDSAKFCSYAHQALDRLQKIVAPLDAYVISDYDVTVSENWTESVVKRHSVFADTDEEKELFEAYQGMVDATVKFNNTMREKFGYNRAVDPRGYQGGTLSSYIGYNKSGELSIILGQWLELVKRLPR